MLSNTGIIYRPYKPGEGIMKRRLLPITTTAVLLLTILAPQLEAQNHYFDQWYFGNHGGLDFRSGIPVTVNGALVTSEGCASICDPTSGELLFYTNGVFVWNREGNIMPNGSQLYGNVTSTQSAVIVPHPGNPNLFYVVTADAGPYAKATDAWGISYSIVDMRKEGGLGDVTVKNDSLLAKASEKLVAVRHCNGKDFWVIAHELGSSRFFTWEITESGLNETAVISDIGIPHSDQIAVESIGVLKVSPNGRYLVSVVQGRGEIFRFNNLTGEICQKLDDISAKYGASFSPNSNLLYVGDGTAIYRYTILENSPDAISDTKQQVVQPSGQLKHTVLAMQLAPNGKMYVAEDSRNLGRIDDPDNPTSIYQGDAVRFNQNNQSGLIGLPNCIDGYFSSLPVPTCEGVLNAEIRMSDSVICPGETIDFTDASSGNPFEFMWRIEGGNPSFTRARNPRGVLFDEPGLYRVYLTVGRNCDLGIDSATVRVVAPPDVDAGGDRIVCLGDTVHLQGKGADRFEWSSSPSSPSSLSCTTCPNPVASPTGNTTYYLRGRDNSTGCEGTDSVVVRITAAPDVRVTADTAICRGESIQLVASGANNYEWEDVPSLSCKGCANPIATPVQTTTYRVRGKISGNCEGVDSVTVEVRDIPFAEAGDDQTLCFGGSFLLGSDLSPSSPDLLYEWSPREGLDDPNAIRPKATPPQTTRYYVRVTNKVTVCFAVDSVLVSLGNVLTANAGNDTTLCAGSTVVLGSTESTPNRSYQWSPTTGLDDATQRNPLASPTETTTYILRVFDNATECEAFDSVTVVVLSTPLADAGEDRTLCIGGSTLLGGADPGSTNLVYRWSPADGLDNPASPHPVATPAETTIYFLEVSDPMHECRSFDTVVVNLRPTLPVIARIRRDYHAVIGNPLEISVESDLLPSPSGVSEIDFELEYDEWSIQVDAESVETLLRGTLLEGWSVTTRTTAVGRVQFHLAAPPGVELEGSGTLLRFIGRMYLGREPGTELKFKLSTQSTCLNFVPEPGYARPDTICGMSLRLIEAGAARYAPPRAIPNPSGSQVKIELGLGLEGPARLEVFDVSGNRVGVLIDQTLPAGEYGVDWDASGVGAGAYWLRLSSGETVLTGQVIVE